MSLPRRVWSLGSLLFLILALGCGERHPAAVPTPPAIVLVAQPVELDGVEDYQIYTARTQAMESVDIKPRVTGYLMKIGFKDGEDVKKDQVLFEIDDRPYKAQLDAAKADAVVRQASLVKTQAEYDIGLRVQKQDKTAISEQELTKRLGARDEAKGGVDQAKAALEKAQLYYDWCKVTSPLDGRANRHFIDVGNLVSQDVSTLTNIVSLKPTWAYFDVDENTALHYQDLVAKGDVKSARKTEIPVKMALSNDVYAFDGVIDFLSNQLDPNTGSIRLRAVFPNKDERLLAGLFGRIKVPISAPHKALLVADAAIGTNQGQKFLLLVNDQNVVEYRAVEVGQLHTIPRTSPPVVLREVKRYRTVEKTLPDGTQKSEQVEVLKPTDWVIVEGLQRVRPGATVKPDHVDMATMMKKSELTGKNEAAPKK